MASSWAWRLVWKGGLDLLTRPITEEKENSEVDNWSDWPPGRITGLLEDALIKKPTLMIGNNQPCCFSAIISFYSTALSLIDVLNGFFYNNVAFSVCVKFICGTCWIQAFLHARVCVGTLLIPVKTECKCTKKGTLSALQSPFAESLLSWFKRQMMLFPQCTIAHNLWWSKLQLKSAKFLFPIKERGAIKNTY